MVHSVKLNHNNLYGLLCKIYLLLLILSSGGIYGVAYGPKLKLITLLLLVIVYVYSKSKYSLSLSFSSNSFFIISVLTIIMIVHSIFNGFFLNNHYVSFLFSYFLGWGYCYIRKYDISIILDDLYYILFVILVHSFINVVLVFTIPDKFMPRDYGIYGAFTLHNIFFYMSWFDDTSGTSLKLLRLNGWFWEPGVLQFYLNLLLYIALYNKKNYKILYLLPLLIILTFSTTGIIIMVLIIGVYAYTNTSRTYKLLLSVCLLIPLLIICFYNIKNKTQGEAQGSAIARSIDTIAPLSLSIKNPFFGIGLGNEEAYFQYLKQIIKFDTNFLDRGSSNGFASSFAALGFISAIIYWILYYRSPLFKKNRFFFGVFILGFIGEPICFTPFGFVPMALSLEYLLKYKLSIVK